MLKGELENTSHKQSTMPLATPHIPIDWGLSPENKHSRQLNEQLSALARRLVKTLQATPHDKALRLDAVSRYYRKYYTMTLCKSCVSAGINRAPARDRILDFPWWELEEDRIMCLKAWEKINP